jgi:hypothetical protein
MTAMTPVDNEEANHIAKRVERYGVEHDRSLLGWGLPDSCVAVFRGGNITNYVPLKAELTPVVATPPSKSEFTLRVAQNNMWVDFKIMDEDGEVDVRGEVRWDGCMNWETTQPCMVHFYHPDHIDVFAATLKAILSESFKLMGLSKEA